MDCQELKSTQLLNLLKCVLVLFKNFPELEIRMTIVRPKYDYTFDIVNYNFFAVMEL